MNPPLDSYGRPARYGWVQLAGGQIPIARSSA